MKYDATSYLASLLSAGWIGNDAVSVVIGESDPYLHISGRVRHSINLYFGFRTSTYLRAFTQYLCLLSSGSKSSTCCCCSDDNCNDYCYSFINSYCSPHPYGDVCSEGKYKALSVLNDIIIIPLLYAHIYTNMLLIGVNGVEIAHSYMF